MGEIDFCVKMMESVLDTLSLAHWRMPTAWSVSDCLLIHHVEKGEVGDFCFKLTALHSL